MLRSSDSLEQIAADASVAQPLILALDLGTLCGWALGPVAGGGHRSGTWALQNSRQRRFESAGMKWVRLDRHLHDLIDIDRTPPSHVVIEEVRRHAGTDAAHAYGGALATVTAWCERVGISYESIPVGTIKRHATGRGNADKNEMMVAARVRGWSPSDDNEADALWLLDLALSRRTTR